MPKPFSSNLDDWCSCKQLQRGVVKRGQKVKHTDDVLAVAPSHQLSLLASSCLVYFSSEASSSWIFHYESHWLDTALQAKDTTSHEPSNPPSRHFACYYSSVSTNAFRLESTCFFFHFFFSFCRLLLNCTISRL